MENKEEIIEALDEFAKQPTGKIIPVLDQYLSRIASTGVTIFPWSKLKPLLIHKLDTVVQDFQQRCPMSSQSASPNVEHVSFEVMRNRLISDIDQFNGIPFTIQRLCELVTNPTKHYQKTDKYMRGVEKNLVVVTTVDPYGNRIVNENKVEVNGVKVGGDHDLVTQSDTLVSSFLPPVPLSSSTNATNSWFSSLSSVVDSPSSYPNWSSHGQDSVIADNSRVDDSPPTGDSDLLEPPRKMPRLENDDDADGPVDSAGGDSSSEAIGQEQKAIAPLLTQLLSASGAVEPVISQDSEQDKELAENSDGSGRSHAEENQPEPADGGDSYVEATGNVDEHGLESISAADNTCDSTNAITNYVPEQFSAKKQFSNFDEKSDSQLTADSSGLQETHYDYDMQTTENQDEQKLGDSDAAHLLPSSEWSSLSDCSSNIDSVSNDGSECGVDSLLETSETNVSFVDAELCDFGDGSRKTANQAVQECEPTSEAQAIEKEVGSVSELASSSNPEFTSDEQEQVGSSPWSSNSVLPMDTD